MRDEPAGKGKRDRRGQRDGEDHEAEVAAVDAEPVLQRREPRDPDTVEGAEPDECGSERDMRGANSDCRHLEFFYDAGDGLAEADAHRGDAVPRVATLQLGQEGRGDAGSGCTERMAE